MVAGNPCYSGDIPLLPSSTTSAANNYPIARRGEPAPVPVPAAGDQVRLTVGNCYEIGAPVNPIQPQSPDSPAVTNLRPVNPEPPTQFVPTGSDLVRAVVSNCYAGEIPLKPDPGPYYPTPSNEIVLQPTPPNGSDIIRQLVQNCYGPFIPNSPSPNENIYPRPRLPDDPSPDDPVAGEVIRNIVQRCYPAIPAPPIIAIDDDDDGTIVPVFPECPWCWLCEYFPNLPLCDDQPRPNIPDPDIDPTVPDGEDCAWVHEYKLQGIIKRHNYPREKDKWIVTGGAREGEILTCNYRDDDPDPGWDKCVQEALECIFKPYTTGTWRTPPVDCDNFYFRGQNSTTKKICVANCFPERQPIYEYIKGSPGTNIQLTPISTGKKGGTQGSFAKHNLRVVTTDSSGNFTGRKVFVEAGNLFFNSAGTQTYNVSVGGATVTFNVTAINDGGEFDTEWWVSGFSGSLPAAGTVVDYSFNAGKRNCDVRLEVIEGATSGQDHRYGLTPTPDKPGYVLNGSDPVFYLLKNSVEGAVPIFRFYSDTVSDTMLTANPGRPDGPGAGERAFLDRGGYTEGIFLGYAFRTKDKATGWIAEGERIQELYRYYNDGVSTVTGTFDSSNNIVVSGGGSGDLKIYVEWDDDPSTAGVAFSKITIGGKSISRRGEKGSGSFTFPVTSGNTYPVTISGYQGGTRKDGNTALCLYDGHSTDCNAMIRIGGSRTSVSTNDDHMYSLVKMGNVDTPPTYDPSRLSYKIPSDPKVPFIITYNIKQGSAAYHNSWGVCITNEDGDNIYWSRVIVADANRDIETTQYSIPLSTLKSYKGKYLVFFMIPNGNSGGLSDGQSISFSRQAPGWKHSSSVEGDWVFFSNNLMNPNQDSKVVFHGNDWQWWEDLLNGDDDFDDFKVRYEISTPGSEWEYEGIECYVYDRDRPEPIEIDIMVREGCNENIFDDVFSNSILFRAECGPKTPASSTNEHNISKSGKCHGEYTNSINTVQTITAQRSGQLSLKAFGALIRSPESEKIKFTFVLKKNGGVVYQDTISVKNWPFIGHNFADFSVARGDTVTFELTEVLRGPLSGMASLGLALFDRAAQVFEKPWNFDVGTTPNTGEAQGRTEVASANPRINGQTGANITSGGRIKKVSIQLWDYRQNEWTDKVSVWDQGQLDTNAANGQAANWNDVYYAGSEWNANAPAWGFYEDSGNRRGHVLSTQIDSTGPSSATPSVRSGRGIYYNSLFEHGRGLICKPSAGNQFSQLRDYVHMSNSQGFMAWFAQFRSSSALNTYSTINSFNSYYATGINSGGGYPKGSAVTSNGQYSKMSFMHDYILGEYGNKKKANDVTGKLRMAFWPYTIKDSSRNLNPRSGNSIYWGCAIELFDVLDEGYAYSKGQSFDLEWPPRQPTKSTYEDANSNPATPHYPRDANSGVTLPTRIRVKTVGEDADDRFNNSFQPKESIYQESHNRDSNVWYICQSDRALDRIKFRITIEEVY